MCVSLKRVTTRSKLQITGDPHGTCYRNQAEYFDIEGVLRARRLDWVGETLRTTIPSLAREVLVSRAESNITTKHCQEGSIMMDVPPHTTMRQLMALAKDKPGWMELVREIHSPESRKSSYTRRSVEDPEAEEWYIRAQNIQFNE